MTKTTVEMLDLYARVARSRKPARMKPGKSMAAAGANILTCKLNCIVCSAARSGKPMFFKEARTGLLCQMLPSGKVRRHRRMNWCAQTTIERVHNVSPLFAQSGHVRCNFECPLWANSGHCSDPLGQSSARRRRT
jgi:hypothetical protein